MTPINDDVDSFGSAFGVNPDGTPFESEEVDDAVELDDEPEVEETPEPAGDGAGDTPEDTPEEGGSGTGGRETAEEKAERLYAGKYKTVEEMERGYQELQKAWDGRKKEPEPEPEEEPAGRVIPLFKGDVSEIKTEADLYNWATADPEAAAMFVMENHARVDDKLMDDIMNNWIAAQPWKATTTIQAWQTQMLREEWQEQRALADSHVIDQIRDQGIKEAKLEQPLLDEYSQELGEYIEQNPHLNQMVEGARTAAEVKNALHAIFYMMAGPKLSQQALEAQVAQQVKAEQAAERKAKREAEQAAATQRGTTITRNTGKPPTADEDAYDEQIRQQVLNSKR